MKSQGFGKEPNRPSDRPEAEDTPPDASQPSGDAGPDTPSSPGGIGSEPVRMIAHDVRAPLSTIIGYAKLLQDSEPNMSSEGREMIGRIQGTGQRLLDMVNNILQLALLDSQTGKLIKRECRLSEIAEGAIADVSLLAQEKGHDLVLNTSGDEEIYTLDALAITEALHNLLTNSIKYTDHGGKIALSVTGTPELVTFAVSDNGMGMSAHQVERILGFDFAEKSGTHPGKGGLGLSIVKKIVDLHGGKIELKSNLGEGTTFAFTVKSG